MLRSILKRLLLVALFIALSVKLLYVPVESDLESDSGTGMKIISIGQTGTPFEQTLYSLKDKRSYGYYKNSSIDFEALFGITVETKGKQVDTTAYSHTTSVTDFDNITVTYDDSIIKTFNNVNAKSKDIMTFDCNQKGLYVIEAVPVFENKTNTKLSVYGYVYYDGKTAQTCRLATGSISDDISAFETLMADADPKSYLSNDNVSYPTSGTDDHVNAVPMLEKTADELIKNDEWSDEVKIIAFMDYITKNYAYDYYRVQTLQMTSRAKKADKYNDISLYAPGNHVGVCWDFTNMMVIMCRHYGIPATSVETKTHTAPAVYLNGEWVMFDVTGMLSKACYTEDVSPQLWASDSVDDANQACGTYTLDSILLSHDNEVWNLETMLKH